MSFLARGTILSLGLICLWQAIILIFHLPNYILPSFLNVLTTLYNNLHLILRETICTAIETLIGLSLGIVFGCCTAISMALCRNLSFWILPILLISQAIPTFALAPLIVIWFGYGISSKIITTILMLFFPIVSAFYDGLKRTEQGWLDLATTMNANRFRQFIFIRIPAALPSLASGIRVATAIAPIGAVIGEWVGASHGLGYLMLNANARMQISLMFAALFALILFSLTLYFSVNKLLLWCIPWQTETH